MKSTLIKCGFLVTLDPAIGEIKGGELLISGNTIKAAGRNLNATADETIDASDKIVMPGLVNAHMHTWETALRGIGAEWMSADYFKHVHSNLATRYKPEDNYVANLMGALAQIDAGCTTLVDWCHNITTHRARRARGGRPGRQRHPRGVRARHGETDRARDRHAVHPRAASARADRGAAQGQARRATTPA